LAGWADTGHFHWIELELTRCNSVFPAGVRKVLMPLTIFIFLLRELRIAAAEAIVRDVAVDLLFMQVVRVGFVGEAGISGDNRAGFINVLGDSQLFIALLNRLQHGL